MMPVLLRRLVVRVVMFAGVVVAVLILSRVIVQLRDVLFGHKIPTIWPEMKAQLDPVCNSCLFCFHTAITTLSTLGSDGPKTEH